jgi:hypothetical protein
VHTFCPVEKRVTFAPTEITVPQASELGILGKEAARGYNPYKEQSVRLERHKTLSFGFWYLWDDQVTVVQRDGINFHL